MATSDINKIDRILRGPCTNQLRDVLRHRIPPNIIRRQRGNLKSLSQPQLDLIFPQNGEYTGNYDDMDISLIYTLLRNIGNIKPHNKGWGNTPDSKDDSLSASIERIREARNRISHSPCLSKGQLEVTLDQIKSAVKIMDEYLTNENKYEKEINNICDEDKMYLNNLNQFFEFLILFDSIDSWLIFLTHYFITAWIFFSMKCTDFDNFFAAEVNRLKQRLIETHASVTKKIPLSPVPNGLDEIPVEQLFSSVVIQEDMKETRKRKKLNQDGEQHVKERKEVKTPEDLLSKNGRPVSRIFMLGKAAHGKTTYCMWLLSTWCKAQRLGVGERSQSEWVNALSQYDFVFHLQFRHVDPSITNVTEMICQNISKTDSDLQTTVTHVLSSKKYRCLIIMDGLDEWKPNKTVARQLRYKGMPNIENMTNCQFFTTMRPWRFSFVEQFVLDNDMVIEILGLDDKGIENIIEKVLEEFYGLTKDTEEYKEKYLRIMMKMQTETMKSFIKIPLLAVVCVQIWYERIDLGNSMTSFYVVMVDMLIRREQRRNDPQFPSDIQSVNQVISSRFRNILSSKRYMNFESNIGVLLKLGKVAYDGLLSKGMKLIYGRDELGAEIGPNDLQFALGVGLVSEREAPSVLTSKVSLQFFHKSIQEFLAAIYVVGQDKISDIFCKHLSTVPTIMELSNVIIFICGICPSLGYDILHVIENVSDSDKRTSHVKELISGGPEVREIYKLQVQCQRELENGQSNGPVTINVKNIQINEKSDKETVDMTRRILSGPYNVELLYIHNVTTDANGGITNAELNAFLSCSEKTRSLISLYITDNLNSDRFVNQISVPSIKYLNLDSVKTSHTKIANPLLLNLPVLQTLTLWHMNLYDRNLGLTSNMVNLQKICFLKIMMTPSGWERFVRSLIDINHTFYVSLVDTDIDECSKKTIRSSPHFDVTNDGIDDEVGRRCYDLSFWVHWKR